jgi:transposase
VIQDCFQKEAVLIRGLMRDEEWDFFEPFVKCTGARPGRPPSNHRLVLDGIFWIARTDAQWRDLPDYFGKWYSVYRQFRRWTVIGLWELLLEALNETEGVPASLQMIDSTIIGAHQHADGAKGGLKKRVLGAQKVALRQRFICASMQPDCR